jgi:hypothetical protein
MLVISGCLTLRTTTPSSYGRVGEKLMDRMLPSVGTAGTSPARRSVRAALTIVSAVVFVATGAACQNASSTQLGAISATASAALTHCPLTGPPLPSAVQTHLIPVVIRISPRSGAEAGHAIVVITGRCFTAVEKVDFGTSLALRIKVDSSTQITATSPPGTGTVYVTVLTLAGRSAPSALSQFTYKQSAALSPLAGKPPLSSPGPAGASPGLST